MLPIMLAAGEAVGEGEMAGGGEFGDDVGLVGFGGGQFKPRLSGCSGHG